MSLKSSSVNSNLKMLYILLLFSIIMNSSTLARGETTGVNTGKYTRNDKSLVARPPEAQKKAGHDYAPIHLATQAALRTAESRWEVFAIGKPVPCSDIDGFLVAYQFPVAVGTDTFPEPLSPPPAGQVSKSALNTRELWGIPEFWTIVVSARKDDYPVPVYYQGLPPMLVNYHKALETARQILETDNVGLDRYVTAGRPGDFYIFSSPDGRKAVLGAFDLREQGKEIADIKRAREKKEPISTEMEHEEREKRRIYREQVDKAWGSIERKSR